MSAMEGTRIEAKEPLETDVAGGGATWKAASEAQSSKPESLSLWRTPGLASTGKVRWR